MTETMVEKNPDIDVSIMRCPITKQGLVYKNSSLLATTDGSYAYPIKDGIFYLNADNAIHTNDQQTNSPFIEEKEIGRDFYDEFGWKLTKGGIYRDTAVWVDQRPHSYEYNNWCMRRVGAYLPRSGKYLLDAG